jgi:hypothetical protein
LVRNRAYACSYTYSTLHYFEFEAGHLRVEEASDHAARLSWANREMLPWRVLPFNTSKWLPTVCALLAPNIGYLLLDDVQVCFQLCTALYYISRLKFSCSKISIVASDIYISRLKFCCSKISIVAARR